MKVLKWTTWGSVALGFLFLIFGSSYYAWNLSGQLSLAIASFLFAVWGRYLLREKEFSRGQLFVVFSGVLVLFLGIWDVPHLAVLTMEVGMLFGSFLEFTRIQKWIESKSIDLIKKNIASIATIFFILTVFEIFGQTLHWTIVVLMTGQVFLIWAFSGAFQKKYKFNFMLGTIGGAIITVGSIANLILFDINVMLIAYAIFNPIFTFLEIKNFLKYKD